MKKSKPIDPERLEEYRKRIQRLRPIDDAFMNLCFRDNPELAQFILRVILNDDTIVVKNVQVQYFVQNLHGRSVRFDIHGTIVGPKLFVLELQRDEDGASPKRARFNSSQLDVISLPPGQDPEDLPDAYMIFITETDAIGNNQPIYWFTRNDKDSGLPFNDRSNIIYVNCACKDESTPLGKLAHDLCCTEPEEMYHEVLRDIVYFYKRTAKGERIMCKEFDEVRQEGVEEGLKEGEKRGEKRGERKRSILIASEMIKDAVFSAEQIAKYSHLPLKKVNELKQELQRA